MLNAAPAGSDEESPPSRPQRRSEGLPPLEPTSSSDDGWVAGEQSIPAALEAMREGSLVLLAEDGEEQTQLSLVLAPHSATPEQMEFVMQHAKLPRLAMDPEQYALTYSSLHQIVLDNYDLAQPALSVSVAGSAPDPRNSSHVAETLRALAGDALLSQNLQNPGAVSLVSAARGGLLKRAGVTEMAVELAKQAGLPAMALKAELHATGWESLLRLSEEWGLPYTTTADMVAHLRRKQVLIERCGPPARMPTKFGLFTAHCFKGLIDGVEHIALVKTAEGEPDGSDEAPFAQAASAGKAALVRVHSECCTGDIFGSLRCDCGPQLELALEQIQRDGHGVLLYLRGQEGRGIGLGAKMHAYALQERGVDTMDANTQLGLPVDSREYGTGAQILVALGIKDMRLISNNPKKFTGLAGYGLRIVERVPSKTVPNPENLRYLRTKEERMGHMLDSDMIGVGGAYDVPGPSALLGQNATDWSEGLG